RRRSARGTATARWPAAGWVAADERRDGNQAGDHGGGAGSARRHAHGQPARDLHHLVPRLTPLLARPLATGCVAGPATAVPHRLRIMPEPVAGRRVRPRCSRLALPRLVSLSPR